jgi:hypothetical protein
MPSDLARVSAHALRQARALGAVTHMRQDRGRVPLRGEVGTGSPEWLLLPPGSVIDSRDGSGLPLLVRKADGRWIWASAELEPQWTASGYMAENLEGGTWRGRPVFVGRVTVGCSGKVFRRELGCFGVGPG